MNTQFEKTIEKKCKVNLIGSFGATEWEEKNMTFKVEVDAIKQYGSFEVYSDCGDYHAEGGLWFDKGELVDYDGIFNLCQEIKDQLNEWGFTVE